MKDLLLFLVFVACCIALSAATQAPAPPRLSGNCGPAAQGLTPDGDVVPIKVDRGGHVLVSGLVEPGR